MSRGGGGTAQRYTGIESLRGIAATLVFVCHATIYTLVNPTGGWFRFADWCGCFGISIFFVISGFVLYRPLLVGRRTGRELDLVGYLLRRALRILPLYWVLLVFFCRIESHLGVASATGGLDTHTGFYYLFLVQDFNQSVVFAGGIGPAWTLSIEATFYLALPLLAWVSWHHWVGRSVARGARELWWLLGLFGVSLAYRALEAGSPGQQLLLTPNLLGYIGMFAVGMALARITELPVDHPARILAQRVADHRALVWAFVALLLAGLSAWRFRGDTTVPMTSAASLAVYAIAALVGLLVVIPAVFGAPSRARRLAAVGEHLGRISYGIYLWQFPLIAQGLFRTHGLPRGVQAVVIYLVVVALATLTYFTVERPAIRLGRVLTRRWEQRGAQPVAAPLDAA